MTDLLPLEQGLAVRSHLEEQLRSRLLSFTTISGPTDEVDLVLLASATALLQEGSESQAAIFAQEQLARYPGRVALIELAKDPLTNEEVLRPLVEEYLIAAGCGSDPVTAFQAIGDIYLGRVHRLITHPILGVGCVAYFSNAGLAESQIASITARCSRLWSDWRARTRDLDEIEQQALAFADDWVKKPAR